MRRPPPWIALVPLAAAAALLGVGIAEWRRARPDHVAPWVEPAQVELDAFPAWADPRWRVELEALLDAWPAFRADDEVALDLLEEDLRALAFTSEVDRPRVDAAGGLRIGLRVRRPVAAVEVRGGYLTLDEAGVLLPGRWPSPPRRGELFLPVILARLGGEPADAEGGGFAFDLAAPGDWLQEVAHVAALDVALSLDEHLDPEEEARLGRVAIDGSGFAGGGARDPARSPGVVIVREDGRRILFGRPPSAGAAGELPAREKWRSVAAALERLEDPGGEGAWDLCDVRWDVPELRLIEEARREVSARLSPEPEPAGLAFPASWRTDGGADEPRAAPRAGDAPRDASASGGRVR